MEDDFRLMLAVALYHNCGVEVYQRDPNCSAKLPHSALRTLHELECALSGQAHQPGLSRAVGSRSPSMVRSCRSILSRCVPLQYSRLHVSHVLKVICVAKTYAGTFPATKSLETDRNDV